MRLDQLQQAVQAHILDGGAIPQALIRAVAEPAVERWQIYSEAYRLRLAEALATQYPGVRARLGAAGFALRINAFIDATPSVHRSIRDYGSELSAFLLSAVPEIEGALLAELAAFEWLLAAAFDAADALPTGPGDLGGVAPADWPALVFRAVPSLRRHSTRTNSVAAWRAARSAGAADAPPAEEPVTQPAPASAAPVEWLIWRSGLKTEFRSIEPDEAAALDGLLGGGTFGSLCERLAQSHGEVAALQAAGWLKTWLTEGLLLRD